VAYTTQTLDQSHGGGFNVLRFIAWLFVVTLVVVAAGAAVLLSPLSATVRALTFHSSIVDRGSPLTLAPGTAASVTLRFRNAGLTAWERGGNGTQVDLGVKNDSVEFARAGADVAFHFSHDRQEAAAREAVTEARAATDAMDALAQVTIAIEQLTATQHELVDVLLDHGCTWSEVGQALSTSPASAQRRFPRRSGRVRAGTPPTATLR